MQGSLPSFPVPPKPYPAPPASPGRGVGVPKTHSLSPSLQGNTFVQSRHLFHSSVPTKGQCQRGPFKGTFRSLWKPTGWVRPFFSSLFGPVMWMLSGPALSLLQVPPPRKLLLSSAKLGPDAVHVGPGASSWSNNLYAPEFPITK